MHTTKKLARLKRLVLYEQSNVLTSFKLLMLTLLSNRNLCFSQVRILPVTFTAPLAAQLRLDSSTMDAGHRNGTNAASLDAATPRGVQGVTQELLNFDDLDQNHDGVIDRAEFRAARTRLALDSSCRDNEKSGQALTPICHQAAIIPFSEQPLPLLCMIFNVLNIVTV